MKASKIKSVSFDREWSNPNGIVYYHTVEFENGDKGQVGTKEKMPAKLAVGTEHSYELETTDRGNKIKITQPANSFGGGGGKFVQKPFEHDAASFAMSYAKDIYIANMSQPISQPIDLYKQADAIYNWLISKKVK